MARTLNGVGTTYRGVGRPDADGWRPATLWFVVFGMPVIPLRRVSLRPVGESREFLGETVHLQLQSAGWIRPTEVLLTYAQFWGLILPAAIGPFVAVLVAVTSWREALKDLPDWMGGSAALAAVVWIAIVSLYTGARLKARLLAPPRSDAVGSSAGGTAG